MPYSTQYERRFPRREQARRLMARLRESAPIAVRSGKRLTLQLYGPVGQSDKRGLGIHAAEVIGALRKHRDAREIDLHVDSCGGYVDDAFVIYTALRAHPAHVTATAGDDCMSAATVIFMAGDRREAYPYTKFLFHSCELRPKGDKSKSHLFRWTSSLHGSAAKAAAQTDKRVLDIYVERTGGDRRWLERELQTELPMTLLVAEQHGIIHCLVGGASAWDALDYADSRRQRNP